MTIQIKFWWGLELVSCIILLIQIKLCEIIDRPYFVKLQKRHKIPVPINNNQQKHLFKQGNNATIITNGQAMMSQKLQLSQTFLKDIVQVCHFSKHASTCSPTSHFLHCLLTFFLRSTVSLFSILCSFQ